MSRPSDDRRLVQLGDKSYEVRVVENCAETGIIVLEVAGERIPVTVTEVTQTAGRAASAAAAAALAGGGEAPKVPDEVKEGV